MNSPLAFDVVTPRLVDSDHANSNVEQDKHDEYNIGSDGEDTDVEIKANMIDEMSEGSQEPPYLFYRLYDDLKKNSTYFHTSHHVSLQGNGLLPAPALAVIAAQYSWNCVDCPMRNSKGTCSCAACGHVPGARAPPYIAASEPESLLPAPSVNRVMSLTPRPEPMINSIVVSGYLRQCTRALGDQCQIPDALEGLVHQFSANFFRWDNGHDFECRMVGDRAICQRRDRFIASDVWRNCFALFSVGYGCTIVRYRWTLLCQFGEKVIIGFMETNASSDCMLTNFAEYPNGYGVCSDGRRIAEGHTLYSEDSGFDLEKVQVDLQWVFTSRGGWKCQFLVNQRKAFELEPDRQYRLAVAVSDGTEVWCTDFVQSQQTLNCLSWHGDQ